MAGAYNASMNVLDRPAAAGCAAGTLVGYPPPPPPPPVAAASLVDPPRFRRDGTAVYASALRPLPASTAAAAGVREWDVASRVAFPRSDLNAVGNATAFGQAFAAALTGLLNRAARDTPAAAAADVEFEPADCGEESSATAAAAPAATPDISRSRNSCVRAVVCMPH